MQELAGRVAALDDQTSRSLKIIAHFDALLSDGATTTGLVRSAAQFAEAAIGYVSPRRTLRYDADGHLLDHDPQSLSAEMQFAGGTVWLARDGAAHPTDSLMLERLSLAITVVESHESVSRTATEVALDGNASASERTTALTKLKINANSSVRVLVYDPAQPSDGSHAATLDSPQGPLRAAILNAASPEPAWPHGCGPTVPALQAPASLPLAIAAFHLVRADRPMVRADDLGILLEAAERMSGSPLLFDDVNQLRSLDERTLRILEHVVQADSIRSAARNLDLHHSTVLARVASMTTKLGYDPSSGIGRLRLGLALLIAELAPTEPPSGGGQQGD